MITEKKKHNCLQENELYEADLGNTMKNNYSERINILRVKLLPERESTCNDHWKEVAST